MAFDRYGQRVTFDTVAELYDKVRPGYPKALFDDIAAVSGIPADGRMLEIGCGTGQATLPFARRGYRILAIELGENLAAVARHNLRPYPGVEVVVGKFEEWPVEQHEGTFDVAFSATAFHWIEPSVRYHKVAQALRPGGTMALFWNKHVETFTSQPFFAEVQSIYERHLPETARNFRLQLPEEVKEEETAGIDASGLFGSVTVLRYVWEQVYDAATYINVLNTYSDHRLRPADVRQRIDHDIAQLIDTRYGSTITKGYLTILYLATTKGTNI